jgi:hypothetical protein
VRKAHIGNVVMSALFVAAAPQPGHVGVTPERHQRRTNAARAELDVERTDGRVAALCDMSSGVRRRAERHGSARRERMSRREVQVCERRPRD